MKRNIQTILILIAAVFLLLSCSKNEKQQKAYTDKDVQAYLHAVQYKHWETVRSLLMKGIPVDSKASLYENSEGACYGSPLFYLIDSDDNEHIAFLVEHGADVNYLSTDGRTILMLAANANSPKSTKYLIEHGADVNKADDEGQTALHRAVKAQHFEFARMLIEAGADINAKTKDGETALTLALWNEDFDFAEDLVRRGCELNYEYLNTETGQHTTPVVEAASWKQYDLVKMMVKNGADLNFANKEGFTPLNIAAAEGHWKMADLLISLGANIKQDKSIAENSLKNSMFLQKILKLGAPVNVVNDKGFSPLQVAVVNGNYEAVWLLLKYKASITFNEEKLGDLFPEGTTLLEVAEHGVGAGAIPEKMLPLLKSYGAK